MQDIANNYNHSTLQSISTQQWLEMNNLTNLINPFLSQGITINSLIEMNADQLNQYLNQLVMNGTDKIRLRSKLHHLRVSNKKLNELSAYNTKDGFSDNNNNNNNNNNYLSSTIYNRPISGSFNSYLNNNKKKKANYPRTYKYRENKTDTKTDKLSIQNRPKLYHHKSLNDKYILNEKDEELLDKLINHQKCIENLITHCLNRSNLLNQQIESSLILIDKEFTNIIDKINNKKNEIINKLYEIKANKSSIINNYILWLKQYKQISSNTMSECMKLINFEHSTFKIKTMIDDILNNQDITNNTDKLNIDCNIDVSFDYKSQFDTFLSSICCIEQEWKERKKKNDVMLLGINPIINDLEVIDIEERRAMIKWNGILSVNDKNNDNTHNNDKIKALGLYININVLDENENNFATKCVLNKQIEFDRDNAKYEMNLIGLRSNNWYKIEFNVLDKNGKCLKKIFLEFVTKKKMKIFGFNNNNDRFLVKDNGKTVILKQYDSGSIIYGEYLNCINNDNDNGWIINSVTLKLINISPSGFGIGFATKKFNEFDGWNTGQNGSVILYGNGEFYTSKEFMYDNNKYNDQNGTKLFQFDFMRRNDIITIIINYKLKKLKILNVTRNQKIELNLNIKYIKNIAILIWMGWTNGQTVTITKQKFI